MSSPGVIGAGLIDLSHTGLRCRADLHCRATFQGRHDELLTAAEGARKAHELAEHAYTHVSSEVAVFGFGKSGFGKRKKAIYV